MTETCNKKVRQYRYKCRKCGEWFKRECFGYKDYSALCNKCFDRLVKIDNMKDYLSFIRGTNL